MGTGHRVLAFAACVALAFVTFCVGFLLGSGNLTTGGFPSYKHTERSQISTLKQPCVTTDSASESDLCAQWRAAQASETSAEWTKWGVIISTIGSGFLLWQIMLTREALSDADDATKAALHANDIARGAMRPWLAFENPDTLLVQHSGARDDRHHLALRVSLRLKNFGQSPALSIRMSLELVEMPFISQAEFQRIIKYGQIGSSIKPIQPGEQVNVGDSIWQSGSIVAPIELGVQDFFESLSHRYLFVTVIYKSRFSDEFFHYGDAFCLGRPIGVEGRARSFNLISSFGFTDVS